MEIDRSESVVPELALKKEQYKRFDFGIEDEQKNLFWLEGLYENVKKQQGRRSSREHWKVFTVLLLNLSRTDLRLRLPLDKGTARKLHGKDLPSLSFQLFSPLVKTFEDMELITVERGYRFNDLWDFSYIRRTEKLRQIIPANYEPPGLNRTQLWIRNSPAGTTVADVPEYVINRTIVVDNYNRRTEHNNRLRIIYTDDFYSNGRLYGSDVQGMTKYERRQFRIEGEQLVELDIKNCFGFLLYAHAGRQPHHDIYSIPGMDRKLIKLAFQIGLNSKSRELAKRSISHEINCNPAWRNTLVDEVMNVIEADKVILEHLYENKGLKLMNFEAGCMLKFIQEMNVQDLKVYPIHDGVACKVNDVPAVQPALTDAFTYNGITPSVVIEQ